MVEMEASAAALSSPAIFALLVTFGAIGKHVSDNLLKSVHFDSIGRHRLAKRASFISRVSTLEIVFAFLVNAHFFLAGETMTGELCECRGRFDRRRFFGDFFQYLIVGVSFLSICRCLLQIVAVSKLSRSDIASMTRVYLVPFTCVATGLCVSSWFCVSGNYYYYYDPLTEDYKCGLLEWLQRTVGGSHCVLCYALAWIFTLAVSDSVEFYRHNASVTPARCTTGVASSFRYAVVSSFVPTRKNDFVTEETVVKNPGKQEALLEATMTKVNNPDIFPASADKATSSLLPGSRTVSRKPTGGRPCLSVWAFLRQSAWLHLSLLIYFVILIGAYEFTECSFAYVAFRFHRAAVFSALLVANAILRIIQILVFGHFFRRTLRSYSYIDV